MKKFIAASLVFSLTFAGTLLLAWSFFLEEVVVPYLAHVDIDRSAFEVNLQEATSQNEVFDFEIVQNLGVTGLLPYVGVEVFPIGEIIAPDIDLRLPILYGVTEAHVSLGAATMNNRQQMGQGNYALASHNMLVENVLFSDVHLLQENQPIFLLDNEHVYVYNITTANRLIYPHQVYVIDDTPGLSQLTLITCNEDGSMRVMVQADFVERLALNEISEELHIALDIPDAEPPWLIAGTTVAGSFILALFVALYKKK